MSFESYQDELLHANPTINAALNTIARRRYEAQHPETKIRLIPPMEQVGDFVKTPFIPRAKNRVTAAEVARRTLVRLYLEERNKIKK